MIRKGHRLDLPSLLLLPASPMALFGCLGWLCQLSLKIAPSLYLMTAKAKVFLTKQQQKQQQQAQQKVKFKNNFERPLTFLASILWGSVKVRVPEPCKRKLSSTFINTSERTCK